MRVLLPARDQRRAQSRAHGQAMLAFSAMTVSVWEDCPENLGEKKAKPAF